MAPCRGAQLDCRVERSRTSTRQSGLYRLLSSVVADSQAPRHDRGALGERRGEAQDRTGGATQAADELARLDSWADQLRSDAAAQIRRREQWLRRQATEDATVAGVMVDHAEHRSTLAITTRSGNRHVGEVRGAGAGLVTLELTDARVVIELDQIDTFRALPTGNRPARNPAGHRSRPEPLTMAEVLAEVAYEHPQVTLVTRSGEKVAGELIAVGRDLVMMRPPERGGLVYLPLASLSEALLPDSTGSG